jgi:ubiquinone/menaquinone biosynthesis C-methylase UbiE
MSNSTYPERIVPAETPSGPLASHMVRYRFAEEYCRGKRVLDAACGVGYGAYSLARIAAHVEAIDISEEAVEYARGHYAADNIRFQVMSVEEMGFESDRFETVCSFETIEHVGNPEAFVTEVARVLRPEGTWLVSTPHVPETNRSPDNPFHQIEYSHDEFRQVLGEHFEQVEIFGQRRRQSSLHRLLQQLDVWKIRTRIPRGLRNRVTLATGTTPWEDLGLDEFAIDGSLSHASELVAVCRSPRSR